MCTLNRLLGHFLVLEKCIVRLFFQVREWGGGIDYLIEIFTLHSHNVYLALTFILVSVTLVNYQDHSNSRKKRLTVTFFDIRMIVTYMDKAISLIL